MVLGGGDDVTVSRAIRNQKIGSSGDRIGGDNGAKINNNIHNPERKGNNGMNILKAGPDFIINAVF